MACTNCNTPSCGCSGTHVVSVTCPPACSEVFNMQCIVYTGVDLTCDGDTVISRNDYLDEAITKLVNYVCSKVAPPASVVAGSTFIDVVPTTDPVTDVTTYTVSADMAQFEVYFAPIITNQILAKILAGPAIDVAVDAGAGTVTISHQDTSTVVSPLAVTGTGNTFLQAASFSFDTFGHVTGAAFTTGTVTHQNNFVTAKINPDAGFTWGPNNNPTDLQTAEAPGDTLNFVAGEAIYLNGSTVPSTDAIRISFAGLSIDSASGLSGDGTAASPLVNSKNVWTRFTADDGTLVNADTTNDVLAVVGNGGGIQTTIDPLTDTLKIENTLPNVDQNVWTRFVGDVGAVDADTDTDILNVVGAGGITTTIDPTTDTLEIENTSPATSVALTSAGGTETLVNDGTGPALANKGLTAGNGISLSSDAVSVTITADVQRLVLDSATAGLPYTGGSGNVSIAHTLGEKYISVICFNSDVVVTSVTVTMVSTSEFTINSASDIDKILIIG